MGAAGVGQEVCGTTTHPSPHRDGKRSNLQPKVEGRLGKSCGVRAG